MIPARAVGSTTGVHLPLREPRASAASAARRGPSAPAPRSSADDREHDHPSATPPARAEKRRHGQDDERVGKDPITIDGRRSGRPRGSGRARADGGRATARGRHRRGCRADPPAAAKPSQAFRLCPRSRWPCRRPASRPRREVDEKATLRAVPNEPRLHRGRMTTGPPDLIGLAARGVPLGILGGVYLASRATAVCPGSALPRGRPERRPVDRDRDLCLHAHRPAMRRFSALAGGVALG